ncbi:MAG: LytTR family transcriptional regulator DNA-binding domain-containing protein, partial [Bacteroidota bacterium]
ITHLQIRANRRIHQVELASILYVESVGDYVKFVLENEKELKSKMKISHLAEELPVYFIRIHRAFLVNRNKIEQYSREKLYADGIELPISRTYRKQVLLILAEKSTL